ncbi:hypothetical protein N7519_009905 [Penicillium mononematosum]|uniref:uncharacterized protein n=1 Tax=Penicillium mononematosum TaxID=268346 RepID=UPI00254948EE|nr:uncharacterized protein N7519_009905 [Penicillium mononematosum]KAJ6179444.1 hypothetical protein N7519_009905 [Penicillium mononematosum]
MASASPTHPNRSESVEKSMRQKTRSSQIKPNEKSQDGATLMSVWAYTFGKPAKYLSYKRMLRGLPRTSLTWVK